MLRNAAAFPGMRRLVRLSLDVKAIFLMMGTNSIDA